MLKTWVPPPAAPSFLFLILFLLFLFLLFFFVSPHFSPPQVRNDWLDLRVPVWDRDLQFLPASDKVVTCTAHRQVGPWGFFWGCWGFFGAFWEGPSRALTSWGSPGAALRPQHPAAAPGAGGHLRRVPAHCPLPGAWSHVSEFWGWGGVLGRAPG